MNDVIERYEKVLGSEINFSDSFKKMKEMYGTPSECYDFIRDKSDLQTELSSSNLSNNNLKIEQDSKDILSKLENSRNNYYDNEDEKFLYNCLYSTSFSITKYLEEIDTTDQIEQKRNLVIEKIKTICDVFAPYSKEDRIIYLEEMHLILRILKPQDIIEFIIPSFIVFIEEKDDLKLKFLEKCMLPLEQLFLNDFETAVDQVVINVLPQLENILRVSNDEIQDVCIDTILYIVERMKFKEAITPLNNMITSLMVDIKNENCEVSILKLIAKLADKFMDISHIDEFVESSLSSFTSSDNITARASLPNAIVSLCKNVSSPLFHRIVYPIYIQLCNDADWEVRTYCSQCISEFSSTMIKKHSPSSTQISSLIQIVENYIKDESRYVKLFIFKEFGKFIYEVSLFNQAEFGSQVDNLIICYLEERRNRSFEDYKIVDRHTAFNMPAIILVSSPKLWKTIEEHYFELCNSAEMSIKICISSSFHEIFKILHGCQLSSKFEKQMIEVLEKYIRDNDDIKYRILDHVESFLPLVYQKEDMFSILIEIFNVQDSWRIQQVKGKLISSICDNFEIDKLIDNNFMLKCEEILENDNYSVKKAVAEHFSVYLGKTIISRSNDEKNKALEYIVRYKNSNNYKDRMIFIYLTHRFIKDNKEIFEEYFLSCYIELSNDKVTNVKILLAKILLNYSQQIKQIKELKELQDTLINSEIREIKALYNEIERKKQTTLEPKYDRIYLNFIDCPDPIILNYTSKKLDFSNPDIMTDKSEDALLTNDNLLLSPTSPGQNTSDIQNFNDFLDKI